jgi:hypothetical protein
MIFDVETYYAPDFALAGQRGFDLLLAQLDEAGVDRAVLFPMPDQLNTDNKHARAAGPDSRFVAVASESHLGKAAPTSCDGRWAMGLPWAKRAGASRSLTGGVGSVDRHCARVDVLVTVHSAIFLPSA